MLVKTVLCLLAATNTQATPLEVVKKWKMVDFDFPSAEVKTQAIDSGLFKQENNMPLGLEVFKNKLFVTVPRWKSGVPSSLNYVDVNGPESPKLKPYPNWEINNITGLTPKSSGSKLINVFRVRVDDCDRLWVVDSGIDEIIENVKVLSPPKILVFDLNTDKLLKVYKIDQSAIKLTSFFANIVVDADKGKCGESFAYLADLGGNGLVVYDFANNEAWRVEHPYFHFDPLWGDYNIGGVNFQWTDGIFGASLLKKDGECHKTLYFHPLSSVREFEVSTVLLKNQKASTTSRNYKKFKYVGSRSEMSQSTSSAFHKETGIMFYTLVNKNAVGCWNSMTQPNYGPATNGIVESNPVTMVFPNDLIVDKNNNVWVLTDRMPNFLFRSLDTKDTNFRIMMSPVKEAVKGTVCDVATTVKSSITGQLNMMEANPSLVVSKMETQPASNMTVPSTTISSTTTQSTTATPPTTQ